MKHFHWLDLFRFMAALVVVIAHTRGTVFVDYGSLPAVEKTLLVTAGYAVTRIANEAVVVFFVLSGFLVGGRALERIVQGTFRPVDYAVDRFVRIMLPLLPALALTAVTCLLVDGHFNVLHLLGNLVALQGMFVPPFGGNGPLWSLSYEVWFYVLVFAVGLGATRKKFSFPAVFMVILCAVVFTSLDYVYLFCWLIGVLAYVQMPEIPSRKMAAFAVMLCAYAVTAIQVQSDSASVSVEYLRHYFPTTAIARIILSSGMAIIFQQAMLLKPQNAFMEKMDSAGTTLAAFSYTLYLTHFPLLQLMTFFGLKGARQINLQSITIFWLTILLCLLLAWGMYWFFERHTALVRGILKRRIAGR